MEASGRVLRSRRQRLSSRPSRVNWNAALLAARRNIVTVEEVVDSVVERGSNALVLPSWTVQAIAVVPGGARPSYAHGYYARDNAFYVAWDTIARDRDRFSRWIHEHVMSVRSGEAVR